MNKLFTILFILVILVVVFVPLITQNGIVSSIKNSSDIDAHLKFVRDLANGNQVDSLYYGQYLIGYLFYPFANSNNLETIYVIFCFLVLAASIFVMFYVTKKMFNKFSALICIPVVFFCVSGIVSLFRYGIIFSIINVYIILPFAIYNLSKYFSEKKVINLIISLILLVLFGLFHTTGFYLLGAVIIYVLYKIGVWIWHKTHSMIIIASYTMIDIALIWVAQFLNSKYQIIHILGKNPSPDNIGYIVSMIMSHLTFAMILLSGLTLVLFFKDKLWKTLEKKSKDFIFIIGMFILAMVLITVGRFTVDSLYINRVIVDMVSLFSWMIACLLGYVISVNKSKLLKMVTSVIVVGGAIPTMCFWFK